MQNFSKLKTLVAMQLRDKIDMSYTKSFRATLFKVASLLGQIILSTAAFFVFFFLAKLLKIFSIMGTVPATLVGAMFIVVLLLGIISCTVGLTNALYLTADNKVLLTLPASPNIVFLSKFILYYIFELKKNLVLLLPMFLSYGLVSNAVWFYYPWLIVCYFVISLLPVAVGAVLSIPALYVANFVKQHKWLQAVITVIATTVVAVMLFALINALPANINIAGQWGTIRVSTTKFLDKLNQTFKPISNICLMVVGGTAEITSKLFTTTTLWGALICLGTIAVSAVVTILLTRPLFFKMASSQFEFEKMTVVPRKNKAYTHNTTSLIYETKRSFRSSRYILKLFVSLLILPIAIFLQNKIYAAMNTRLTGQYMTIAFSMLVALLISNSGNIEYSSVYSRDGAARPIAKTQPINPQQSMFVRLVPRGIITVVSTIITGVLWSNVAGLRFVDTLLLSGIIIFCSWAHLLWSAELDIMNNQSEQYATVGVEYDSPNGRTSTILAFLISAIIAFLLYFLMKEGLTKAIIKIFCLVTVFLVARVYLFFTRINLYYAEK